MFTRLIIITLLAIAAVAGMYFMGKFMDRGNADNSTPTSDKENQA